MRLLKSCVITSTKNPQVLVDYLYTIAFVVVIDSKAVVNFWKIIESQVAIVGAKKPNNFWGIKGNSDGGTIDLTK